MTLKPLIDIHQVAKKLKVSENTIRRAVKAGTIRAVRLTPEGKYWFDEGDVAEALKKLSGG